MRISALHRDVARVLTEQGVSHAIEHLTDDHLFSIDIALTGARPPAHTERAVACALPLDGAGMQATFILCNVCGLRTLVVHQGR